MSRKLRIIGLLLVGFFTMPIAAQVNDDEIVIFERDYSKDPFTTGRIHPDQSGSYDDSEHEIWTYSDLYKCAVACNHADTPYYGVSLTYWILTFTDPNYYDVKLTLRHSGLHLSKDTDLKIIIQLSSKKYYYPLEITDELAEGGIVTETINLDSLGRNSNMAIYLMAENLRSDQGEWHIHSTKLTAKHRYGKNNTPVTISTLSELKELPSNTYVKWNMNGVFVNYINNEFACVSDDTGTAVVEHDNLSDFSFNNQVSLEYQDNTYFESGQLSGILIRDNGYSRIKYPDFKNCVIGYGWNPVTDISSDDYWDNVGRYVRMTCENSYVRFKRYHYSDDGMDYTTSIDTLTVPCRATIMGVAYPIIEGEMGFILSDVGYSIKLYLSDSETYDYNYLRQLPSLSCVYERSFDADKWYTLSLPSYYNWNQAGGTLAEYVSCSDGVVQFNTTTTFKPNTPYLVKFNERKEFLTGSINLSNDNIVEGGDYNFVGTASPVHPKDGSYYLTAGNTIRPLASGGTIKAFRAYFEPATPNAAQARAISIDGVVTAIDDIEIDGIKDGPMYNLNGQRVNDSSRKGLYIQNGKKVVK